jgi:hypothetical protein
LPTGWLLHSKHKLRKDEADRAYHKRGMSTRMRESL